MADPMEKVLDGIDFETFLVSESEQEGRRMMLDLLGRLGFGDTDIVFAENTGFGTRIRARAYVERPGDQYHWLREDEPKAFRIAR